MPARRHSFFESPLPDLVVLDSSFVFDAVIESDRARHEASLQFVRRLQREKTALVYSSLLFLEAPQCWRRFFRRGDLRHSHPDIGDDRLAAFKRANTLLQEFLDAFDCQEVAITKSLMNAASRVVAIHDLRAHDALVAALAEDLRVTHIASFDRDFRRLDIDLWDGLMVR